MPSPSSPVPDSTPGESPTSPATPATPATPAIGRGGTRRARRGRTPADIARDLQADPELRDAFAHWRRFPERPGLTADFPAGLDPRLVELFRSRGVVDPYRHQVEAMEHALAGEDVLIATPTASGKTLAYTAPVLQRLLETNGGARSIWMFPTKALSQDQSSNLNALIEALGEPWHSFTYDGDTPPSVRRTLRERGHVILTNPWMLHQGILPNHAKWADLFRGLAYIVIDEVHTLSGVFGSHAANVLRRLVRLAEHYGARPRFLLSSATLRDPGEHAERLIGRPVRVVEADASPSGERIFGVYNPPVVNPVAGLRANALEEARRLALRICGPDHQTIFFCNRRTGVEVLTRYLREQAPRMGLQEDEVRGYRGGYLPLLRREVEGALRSGEVKVVVSTNALELGIDIGRLDAAVLVGYPGTQASFWQRVGRVGRRGGTSLVVMIARSDPTDQYLAHHPEYLFGAPRERLGIDPDNLVILSEQLKCAAFELAFRRGDAFGDAPHVDDVLDYLAEESQLLLAKNDAWYWMADAYPAQDVSLAGGEPDNVLVLDLDTERAIGEVDREGSITAVHEGAIYQVEGETWKIERFDHKNRRAYARSVSTDYFTDAQTDTEVRVLRLEARRSRPSDYDVWSGEVHVTTVATQYKKIRFYTRENVGAEDIHLPPEELDTDAFVITISEESAADLGLHQGDGAAAWRAVGVLVRRTAPLFLRCRPGDLGLSATIKSKHFDAPALFLYERVQGGVGLSNLLLEGHRELLEAALEIVARCTCPRGCPSCVGPIEEVGAAGKETARRVLEHLIAGEPAGAAEP